MSVAIDTIKGKIGENILLTVKREDGTTEEVEGKIEVASEAGVGFKPKGRRELDLLEVEDVLDIADAPLVETKLKQVKLKTIDEGRVKKHLIDRHGAPLSQVNALTAEQAAELHGKIDHSDLGHNHDKKEDDKSSDEVEATDGETEAA